MLDESYADALRLLRNRRHELDALASAPLAHETLDEQEILAVTGLNQLDTLRPAPVPAALEVRPTSPSSAQVAVGRTSGAPLRLGPVWRDTFSAEALGAPAPRAEGEVLSPVEELSPSELRVLRYLPTNLTRPEIARELYLSLNTVNTHLRNIYSKLGARDRSSAVSRARELRILSTARHS